MHARGCGTLAREASGAAVLRLQSWVRIMKRFTHIVVATDFSVSAERAVEMAVDLAQQYDAALTLVHVTEIPVFAYGGTAMATGDLITPIREAAEQATATALAALQKSFPAAKAEVRLGIAAEEILAAADAAHADLIVVGTHGRRGVSHLLLGSVAEKVVRMSPVPVLTMRTPG